MTKHVSAAEIFKHCEYLGFDVSNTRAATAPTLGSLQYEKITDAKNDVVKVIIEEDNNGVDEWKHRGRESVRVHDKPRRTLFTPRRVAGAPPRVALTSARITRGIDVETLEEFEIIDNWTSRATAHACIGRRWTGTTTFIRRSGV